MSKQFPSICLCDPPVLCCQTACCTLNPKPCANTETLPDVCLLIQNSTAQRSIDTLKMQEGAAEWGPTWLAGKVNLHFVFAPATHPSDKTRDRPNLIRGLGVPLLGAEEKSVCVCVLFVFIIHLGKDVQFAYAHCPVHHNVGSRHLNPEAHLLFYLTRPLGLIITDYRNALYLQTKDKQSEITVSNPNL